MKIFRTGLLLIVMSVLLVVAGGALAGTGKASYTAGSGASPGSSGK